MTRRARKRAALLLVILFAAALSTGAGMVVHRTRVARQTAAALRDGLEAEKARDFESALRNLSTYCARNHGDADAVLALARVRAEVPAPNNRHLTTAIAYARAAADLVPSDLRPQELLLDLYRRCGFVTERIETADRIIALSPKHHDALEARASGLAQVGRAQDGLAAAHRLAEAFPEDVAAHRQVVSLMHMLNQPSDAIRGYVDSVAAAHPQDARLLVLQAGVVAQSDANQAAELVKRAAALPLSTAATVKDLVWLMDRLRPGHPELAEAADLLLSHEMEGPLALDLSPAAAERAWKNGQIEDARRFARVAGQTPAETPDAILGWRAILQDADQPADSALVELRSRATASAASWVAVVEAKHALETNDLGAARSALAGAADSSRTADASAELLAFYSSELADRMGEWRASAQQRHELLKRDPGWRTVRLSLVSILRQHGQLDEAASVAQAGLVARLPRQEALVLTRCLVDRLAQGHAQAGQLDVALGIMRDLEQQAPDDPATLALAVRTRIAAGQLADAQAIAARLERLAGPAHDAGAATAPLLDAADAMRRVDPAGAARLIQCAKAVAPSDPSVAGATAVDLVASGRVEDAKKVLTDAVNASTGPARLQRQLRLASLLDESKDPSARSYFVSLADEHSAEPAAQVALLESGVALTEKDGAARAISRLRGIAGEDSTLWRTHQARWLLVFEPSPANAAEAIRLLGEVLRADPHNTDARSLTAEALLYLKDRDGAIAQLAAAVDGENTGVSLYPRLIGLLKQAGRSEEAAHRVAVFASAPIGSADLRRQRAALLTANGNWDQALADYAILESQGTLADRFAYATIAAKLGDRPLARRLLDQVCESADATDAMISFAADFQCTDGRPEQADVLLAAFPKSATAEHRQALRAAYLERHSRVTEAESIYTALAADGSASHLAELARFYLQSGRLSEAASTIARARAADPKNPRALQVGGLIRVATGGSQSEGLSDLATGLEGSDESSSKLRLIRALQEVERSPDELTTFIRTVEGITTDDPGFFPAWRLLVEARWRHGDTEAAIATAQNAARATPTLADSARLATQVLAAAGRTGQAITMARRWRELAVASPLEADLAMARLLGADGRPEESLRLLEPWQSDLLARADHDPSALVLYARVLADNRREQEAHNLLWSRASASRDWTLRYLGVAVTLRDPELARAWLARVEPLLATDAEGAFAIGQAWLRFSREHPSQEAHSPDRARAADFLRRAIESPALKGSAAQSLGECAHMGGDLAQAVQYYRTALKEQADNTATLNNLATILAHDAATRKEAIQLARHAVEVTQALRPVPAHCKEFLETLASALARDEQFQEAELAYRKGLEIDPAAVDLSVGLAEVILAQGRRQEALSVVRRLDAVNIDNARPAPPLSPMARLAALRHDLASLGK